MSLQLRSAYNRIFRPRGLFSFLQRNSSLTSILDVGCGNNSPFIIKSLYPHFFYTGIDIADYNQARPIIADEYLITSPQVFSDFISALGARFDLVISSHNLEHCLNWQATLEAMCDVLKPGGALYLAFPSEASVHFPSRRVTLNFFDDTTHASSPVSFDYVLEYLISRGFSVDFSDPQHRPFLLRNIGLLQEPVSRLIGRNLQGTWAYYGFEAIIWARKNS